MRYKLLAFVCDHNCVRWMNYEGTLTYSEIVRQRPEDCRFAILGAYSKFLCVDTYETHMNIETLELIMPDSLKFKTLDAAIMAAQMKL